ncbi:MAG: alpha/beta fold hydrolase [Candidatus Zixiibacteriota bacterium]|nr:MAG: alpha/beta fold hydrolase [candidate division Zixibacteria bacterium]
MPYADLDTYCLYYEDYPSLAGEETSLPIVFIHGFTIDHRMWVDDAKFFSQWYRVLLLDLKGHGLSDAPETGYSRAHRVDEIVGFLDRLDIHKAHLVGLSMGGTTVLGVALAHPERLASLTLVSTSAAGYDHGIKTEKVDEIARTQGMEVARERWIKSTLQYFCNDKQQLGQLLEQMMQEHSGAYWKDPMRGKYPPEDDLQHVHEIDVPTMIFVGGLDRPFVPLAKTLHERITGSRLSVFEDVGHMLNLESPNRFQQELKLFLEGK